MSTEPETKTQVSFGLTEGLVVAGIPAVGYWLAYLYELGYSRFFRIPVSYIRVDLGTVIGATLGMLGSLMFVYIFVSVLFISIWNYINKTIRYNLIHLMMITLFFTVMGIIAPRNSYIAIFIFWLFFVFVEFGYPLITQRKTKGYINKIQAQQDLDSTAGTLTNIIMTRSPRIFALVFLLYLFSMAAWLTGGVTARFETEFWAPEGDSPLVVVRHYGDTLIAARYFPNSKTLSGEVVIMPAEGSSPTRLRLVKVGPLIPPPRQ